MECGIEGNHLGNLRKHVLHRPDAEQMGRIVERSEVAADLYLLQHILIHEGTAMEILAAVHDSVAHSLDVLHRVEHSGLLVRERVEHEFHTHLVVRDRQFPDNLVVTRTGILEDAALKSNLFDYTLGYEVIDIIALHIKELVLDGRASAIDNKNDHIVFVFQIFSQETRKFTKINYF